MGYKKFRIVPGPDPTGAALGRIELQIKQCHEVAGIFNVSQQLAVDIGHHPAQVAGQVGPLSQESANRRH